MKTRTHARTPAKRRAAVAAPAAFANAQRQQMAVAGEAAGAMVRGFEAMRDIQLRSAQETMARHSAAAGARTPQDAAQFMFAHSELLRQDLEAAAKCWEEIAAAALEMQSEMAACCSHLVDSGAALEAAHALD